LFRTEQQLKRMARLCLKKLLDKRKERDDKKVLDAYHADNKTADEIVTFIQTKTVKSVEG